MEIKYDVVLKDESNNSSISYWADNFSVDGNRVLRVKSEDCGDITVKIGHNERLFVKDVFVEDGSESRHKNMAASENKMDKVWKMLGLDMFEEFNIKDINHNALRIGMDGKIRNPYYFQDEGLINRDGQLDNNKLAGLITGYYKIEKAE